MDMVYGRETLPPRVIAVEAHPNYTMTVTFDDLKGKSGKAFDARLTLEIAEDGKARVMPKF